MIKPGDYEALIRLMIYLRDYSHIAEKFGESGREYVENNLSIEHVGMKTKKVLEKVSVTGE